MRRLARSLAAFVIAGSTAAGCSPGNSRDVVPDSREVRLGADGGTPAPEPASSEGYVYVARRRHASIGLVGSRNAKPDDAARTVDRIADDLDACAARLQTRGDLALGALQLVVVGSENGRAEITDVRVAPGGPVAANALECVIAPLRATMLSPSFTLAIEATWGPAGAAGPGDR